MFVQVGTSFSIVKTSDTGKTEHPAIGHIAREWVSNYTDHKSFYNLLNVSTSSPCKHG